MPFPQCQHITVFFTKPAAVFMARTVITERLLNVLLYKKVFLVYDVFIMENTQKEDRA